MNGFRERMTRFMYGRYGNDQLSRFYLGLALGCFVVYVFTRLNLVYLAGLALLVYGTYRSFSRDITKNC